MLSWEVRVIVKKQKKCTRRVIKGSLEAIISCAYFAVVANQQDEAGVFAHNHAPRKRFVFSVFFAKACRI